MDAQISRGMVAFADFRFDADLRRLLRQNASGEWVPATVGSRALDVLGVLLRQPGELVTKLVLMDEVWPDIAVESNNLTVQITALRKALDDRDISESCIQTVAGRGYRFVAPVARLSSAGVSMTAGTSGIRQGLPRYAVVVVPLRNLGLSKGMSISSTIFPRTSP